MELIKKTNFDFVSKRKIFLLLSAALIIIGVGTTWLEGIDYGIDFLGGTEMAVAFQKDIKTDEVRGAVEKVAEEAEIKSYGARNQFLIRIKEVNAASQKITESLKKQFPDNAVTLLKSDRIGPKIGSELRAQAFWAVFLSIVAMLIYVAFRFEFAFGMAAMVATFHDIIITFTIGVTLHHLGVINIIVDQTILAAMLTVVGYSINDTVVIFDRIRENRELHKGMNFVKMVNLSLNETLSRTIVTGMCTLFVLLILVFMGGPVLQGFAFMMFLGIVIGTYSSVYIASPFLIWYLEKFKKHDMTTGTLAPKGVKA
ncbi:MAG: protein translocase subunit SecF [Chloroflexota bacterium]